MGSVRTCIRPDRRESTTDEGKSACAVLHTHRRKMVRVGDERVRMRRHSPILLPSDSRTATDQEGYRTPNHRMGQTERRRATTRHKVSDADDNSDVLISSRPLQPGRRTILSRMLSLSVGRTVSFDNRVSVYTPIDWSPNTYRHARAGPWMQLAADRCRFKRRINLTEVALGDIFSDSHRDKVKRRLFGE